jgi:protein-S-isoprenylcysteine O-methyltransferase Ste14
MDEISLKLNLDDSKFVMTFKGENAMRLETIFRLIMIGLLLSGTSISVYYRRRAQQDSKDEITYRDEGPFIMYALRLLGMGLWIAVIAYMINPNWMKWASIILPTWFRWSAVGLAGIAWGFTFWMFRSLGKNITATVVTRKAHSLVMDGPYRWIRHPLYTFATLFYISLGLIAANWFIPLIALLVFAMLAVRTPKEEEKLIEKFGEDYRRYMQRTGRFLPRLVEEA